MAGQTQRLFGSNKQVFSRKLPKLEVSDSGYVVNRDIKLPAWVKCSKCGKPPEHPNWLKPMNPADPNCRKLIHLACIPNGPILSEEAGYIARNMK